MKINVRQFAAWCGGSYLGDNKMGCAVVLQKYQADRSA